MNLPRILIFLLLLSSGLHASGITDLFSRGYGLVPEAREVSALGADFEFHRAWHFKDSPALANLSDGLNQHFHLSLINSPSAPEITLNLRPGSVEPGPSQDRDRSLIAQQAYLLELSPMGIRITANAEVGAFYAVQTLLQLIKSKEEALYLPRAVIKDWPDLRLRTIYWDDAHHLEKLPELKAAIRQASFFKLNGFAIKLEGHFQYHSAPAIVEPQALSPAELQDLTSYGLAHHVEVIPYLDAPAHVAFILKHPEYASLRQFPDSNYEFCATNLSALKLLYGMYDDLLAANRGVHYFYLSTDEAYYVGMADSPGCQEAKRKRELGSAGKVLAEFIQKTAKHLHDAGREVIFWGELPLTPDDVPSLPHYIINGETYGAKFDSLYKANGIRQMIYGSTEGEERLFPQYALLPPSRRLLPLHENISRLEGGVSAIASDPARNTSDLIGITIAGWADMGLHPETFWLGYATITASGWKPWTVDTINAAKAFYPLFYGPNTLEMDRVYQLMSYQAQVWTNTWDRENSKLRKPIWGDSEKVFHPGQAAHDQTLPLPPPPDSSLNYRDHWEETNANRLKNAKDALVENDELNALLSRNLTLVTSQSYNLKVFQSISALCRQNLELLLSLQRIHSHLEQASKLAGAHNPRQALAVLDSALNEAQRARDRRNQALQSAITVWYQSWLPRTSQANGRIFLHDLDDVKDHLPDRTIDMSYLIYRDLNLPFDAWYSSTVTARNQYAKSNGIAVKESSLSWSQHP